VPIGTIRSAGISIGVMGGCCSGVNLSTGVRAITRGLVFWVIMLLLLLSMLGAFAGIGGPYMRQASGAIEWILLALLGWNVYGPMLRG
jgi:hypothetical protein